MKKRNILLIILLALLLIVFAYFIYNKIHLKNMEKDCEAKGGVWESFIGGLSGREVNTCNLPTKDTGKWCNDSEQCESKLCAVPDGVGEEQLDTTSNGTCYGWIMENSGYYIENGKVVRLEVDY